MTFSGKATFTAGPSLPELAEDVSDMISLISPMETPLLDALGDPLRSALSTHHEWLEDDLLPNKDSINDSTYADPEADTSFVVANGARFQVGDQIQVEGNRELMLVTAISGNTLTVVRAYAGSPTAPLVNGKIINILGNAALEGGDKPTVRQTNRQRKGNYTQIFTASVEVSGSDLAARQLALTSELDYQKVERLRELLRDLENTIINGGQPTGNPQGSTTVRRTLRGIIPHLATNLMTAGETGMPTGLDLDEAKLNYALRRIWNISCSRIDTIVVNGFQKRRLNSFLAAHRVYGPADETYRDGVNYYDCDYGRCRILVTRWMPQDGMLLLDSTRIAVLPLSGRSFHYKPLAPTGDYESGQLIGEYTLELRNEAAHGYLRGLSTT